MKKYKNLKEFLKSKGVDASTPSEEIERLKGEYRKLYLAHFSKEKRGKRITINPSQKDFEELEKQAAEKDMKLSRYVLDAALAYGSGGYIMPSYEGLDKLIFELNAIGRNINSVVKNMHSNRSYGDVVPYENLRSEFRKVDKLILSYLTTAEKKEDDH